MGIRLHRPALVHELADGTPPTASAGHWGCAERLLARGHRETLAAGLERLIDRADRPRGGISAAIPPQRAEVREARRSLAAAARALRAHGPVAVQGVAMIDLLLRDPAGPAYATASDGALADVARRALQALQPARPAAPAAPAATSTDRILLVSREPGLARALAITLRHHGYVLESAAGLPAAIGALGVRRFVAVVVDLAGVGEGEMTLRVLRPLTDGPLIAFAAPAASGEPARAVGAGADDVIETPYRVADLVGHLDSLVGRY